MTETRRALALDEDEDASESGLAATETYEVVFDEPGELGISVAVDGDGAVVVSKLLQLRGHGELSCPTLHAGDVLVAIDNEPVAELRFGDVMQKLRATADTRPTRLEFVAVGRFDSADGAVARWRQRRRLARLPGTSTSANAWTRGRQADDDDDGGGDDKHARLREGEFDVTFAPLQPTGLRFSESYLMTTPLRLAHVETALLAALGRPPGHDATLRDALVSTLLVRVGDDAVLGAPVDDVMALLYDAESFPKTLWLARDERLQHDFQVVTLATRDQLKWFCFVPCEMMMEVAVVSYAALATGENGADSPSSAPSSASSASHRRRTRSDGICEHQYLMAVNGFPTLRISSASHFSDDGATKAADATATATSTREDDGVVAVVNRALDALLGHERSLRLRDLKAYRREFLAHAPLSPWQRRRRRTSTRSSASECSSSRAASPVASTARGTTGELAVARALALTPATDSPPQPPRRRPDVGVRIVHQPRRFFEIIQDEEGRTNDDDWAAVLATPASPSSDDREPKRPVIRRYRGLANCEGVRAFAAPEASDQDVKCVVVPDNKRPIGIQLETDVTPSGRPLFKAFLRSDGPALRCQRVHVGDRLVAVNGVAVDAIPTDLLVRILHGEEVGLQGVNPTAMMTPSARATRFDAKQQQQQQQQQRSRVLRLARRDAAATAAAQNAHGLLGQAKKLLELSKARLALWKSSQASRASLVQ